MRILFLLPILFCLNAVAQDSTQQFKLTKDGINPIVIMLPGMTADSIYKKAQAWVSKTYKNPDKVIKENTADRIRVNGFQEGAIVWKSMGVTNAQDVMYEFTIEIKDGKVRLTYAVDEITHDGAKTAFTVSSYFKDDGTVRNMYKDAVTSFDDSMNRLAGSLINFIKEKKEDW